MQPASAAEAIPPLDPGEEAAIRLAIEIRADALLIDEKDGRRAAQARGLRVVGTIGVLDQADERGMVELAEVIARLRSSDFRIDQRLI